ncbi:hypothetical protein [Parvularcula marina]|uniref:Lipoprotein n=1 Tax=Parvularcula marina TaxID=2292771 RepID=A0A371RES4_9PROT|nr:hypothetical protein [Parvularcula marina]RFB03953.1 hypothetical protein DX908_00820 [Parvularcula marina]
MTTWNKFRIAAVLGLTTMALAACETTSSRPYKASTANIMAAQTAVPEGTKVSMGDFSAAADIDVSPTCRAMGALEVAPGQTPVEYIRDAMQEELFNAGLVKPDGAAINGEITKLEFSSIGTGTWDVALKVTSAAYPQGYEVSETYSFKTSFSAINACQNTIDAFQPTVSNLLNKVVTHPEFSKLAGA